MFIQFCVPSIFLSFLLDFLGNSSLFRLSLLNLSLLGIQKLLGHTTGILLSTEEEAPQLPHELHCILLHEPCQLDLYVLPVHVLHVEQAVDEVDKHFILEPKELSDPCRNPRLHHVHLHL